MGKAFKIIGWLAAICLILALGFTAALKYYFTPERIKRLITDYASKNLRREITLDSAELGLRGFSIKNFRIAETPSIRKSDFFSAETLSIRPDFKALLRKELKINSISAEGLNINIRQTGKNSFNFSDLVAGGQPAASPKAAGAQQPKPVDISISNISIKRSRLSYSNFDGSLATTLSDLSLKASGISAQESFPFETDFSLGIKSPYLKGDFPVHIKGDSALNGWNFEKAIAEIQKASLKAGKIDIELSGKLENFFSPETDIKLRVKQFSSTDLKAFFPQIPPRILLPAIDADAKFKLTPTGIHFRSLEVNAGLIHGSVKGKMKWEPALDYDLDIAFKAQTPEVNSTELAKKFPVLPRNLKFPQVDMDTELKLTPRKAHIVAAKIKAASINAYFKGSVDLKSFAVSGAVKVDAGDIHDLAAITPVMAPYALKGRAKCDLAIARDKTIAVSGKAEFDGISADVAGRKLSELKGSAVFSKAAITATDLNGKLDNETLKADISIKDYLDHPKIGLDVDIASIKLPELPAPSKEPAGKTPVKKKASEKPFLIDAQGRIRLGAISHPNLAAKETLIKYDLKNVSDDLKGLSGTASFEVNGGKFDKLYELAKTNKAAKVALAPLIILGKASKAAKGLNLPDFNTVVFTKMSGDYSFQDGQMKVQRSELISAVADASSNGNINLVSDTLDLKIKTTLKEGSGIRMSAPITLLVKGTFDDPSVKPDVKSIVEQPAIKKNVEKLLKNLLK